MYRFDVILHFIRYQGAWNGYSASERHSEANQSRSSKEINSRLSTIGLERPMISVLPKARIASLSMPRMSGRLRIRMESLSDSMIRDTWRPSAIPLALAISMEIRESSSTEAFPLSSWPKNLPSWKLPSSSSTASFPLGTNSTPSRKSNSLLTQSHDPYHAAH